VRTCPHCQFLVADQAETCSVCHRDLASARTTVAVGAVAHGAPAPPFGAAPPPGTAYPPGVAPAVAHQPVTARRRRWPLVLGLVLAGSVALVGGLLVLVTVLGFTAEPVPIVADELQWEAYADPAGRYSLELPGAAVVDTVEVPGAFGPTETAAVSADHDGFDAAVVPFEGVIGPGQTFANIPFSPAEVEQDMESTGVVGARIIDQGIIEGSGDTLMNVEMSGTVDGRSAVVLTRLVLHADDLYELTVVGPADDRATLVGMFERMITSFRPA
jgi:hypothetical protein